LNKKKTTRRRLLNDPGKPQEKRIEPKRRREGVGKGEKKRGKEKKRKVWGVGREGGGGGVMEPKGGCTSALTAQNRRE